MGMKHDGENGCDESCCIMSTSIGTGRTLWSSCSAQELNHFIAVRIKCTKYLVTCLVLIKIGI